MRLVERAEINGQRCTSQVNRWLQRAEAVETEVSFILEDYDQRRQRGMCRNTSPSLYKKGKIVSKKLNVITELKRTGDFDFVIANGLYLPAVEEIPSRPAFGLDVMLGKVLQFLQEGLVGIIAIYGMGGVGKTTLLTAINNEFLNEIHHYDVIIWVLVSKEFVADKIQQAIGARLGLSWEGNETQEQRASKIYRALRRKKFLLLLDDIWKGLDLEKIGVPFPDKYNKCKVIFTTRSMQVCSDMDAQRRLRVDFLSEKEAWLLFSKKVGRRETLESDSIHALAKTIVRKCGGLPLALITVGKAMANKETAQEWENAVEELNKTPSELRGMEDVFTLLKFSYDNLERDTFKLCLLYCSLFPEDYSIEKEQLIEYWIGEGFLDGSSDLNVHNKGHDVIGYLKVACLLETGEEESQVKMHDVVRSFALWVASGFGLNWNNYLVEASVGLNEAPLVEDWQGAKRISLLDNGITELSEVPVCPRLLTLLLQWNSGLNRIQDMFFEYMPCLRVLDLSFTSLREIPVSINKLVELHHLDLSGTKIATLPKEIGSLVKLKHLDLQRTYSLRMIPQEAISGLLQLRVLNLYYSTYAGWGLKIHEDEKEVQLADLQCLRQLNTLGMTVTELTTLKRISGFSTILKCIHYLFITECEGLYYLELPAASSESLRRLSINNCDEFQYLDIGTGNLLRSLKVLSLHDLPNLARVWRNPLNQECLRNLQSVNIWYCHNLKNISWVLRLPKLEVIYIFYCRGMEELISGDKRLEEEANAFPSLRTISIRGLPQLSSICLSPLAIPSLERIAVVDCPMLRRLPLKAHAATTLPTIYGTKEWWDQLEWDEASIKSAFLSQFMAT
ncbi:Disease resistance protein [Quillaja saponaria]|uniref:Disease resistance protein n=1 Tax=Quillaja saponaria TaxID=32244 RepID=A0AAD7PHL4_QUISA|nr:Disease resistance protein [Quillaja saponaria]